MPWFYTVGTTTMKTLLLTLTRWEVKGKENVPGGGPLIVVANHLNLSDPPLLSASLPRKITFMAKEELFNSWGGIFVRAFGAFPVRRGKLGKEAIRQGMRVLENGQALGMFPEGKRGLDYQLDEGEMGVAFIALRTGAPILPVGISGSENIKGPGVILQRPRITVAIGPPFSFPPGKGKLRREQLAQATGTIMERIADVLPPGYRGVYG